MAGEKGLNATARHESLTFKALESLYEDDVLPILLRSHGVLHQSAGEGHATVYM